MPVFHVEIVISEPSFLTLTETVIASDYEQAKDEGIVSLLELYEHVYDEIIEYKDISIEIFNIEKKTKELTDLLSSSYKVYGQILALELSKLYADAAGVDALIDVIIDREVNLNYIVNTGILTERELFPEIDRRKKLAKKPNL